MVQPPLNPLYALLSSAAGWPDLSALSIGANVQRSSQCPRKIYAMNGTWPKKSRIVTPSKLTESATPALQAVRQAFNPLARRP